MFHFRLIFLILLILLIEQSIQSIIINNNYNNNNYNSSNDELKIAFLFHRHGERTPYAFYPNDPNKKLIIKKYGIGQMINKGKQRLYKLGQFLANYYYNNDGVRFSLAQKTARKVYARSSGSERCLQSASLLLAGMFPPVDGDNSKWNDDLGSLWQPIPIQTVDFHEDSLLNPDYRCPVAEKLLDESYNNDTVKQFQQKYQKFLDKLASWTGYKPKEMNLVIASYIYDTLLSEKNCNLTQPEWLTDDVWQNLKLINDQVFLINSTLTKNQKFRTGSMFYEIIDRIYRRLDEDHKPDDHLLFIYSTHDSWLSLFLSALNVYDGKPPTFASTFMLEVYQKNKDTEPYFKGFYLNSTESYDIYPLKFPNCEPCTFENFYNAFFHLIIFSQNEIKRECFRNI